MANEVKNIQTETKRARVAALTLRFTAPTTANASAGWRLPRMKVEVKRVNAVAVWRWNVPNDDVCGICRVPFDGCCPDCHVPGDDCPILTGQCKHVFHMCP